MKKKKIAQYCCAALVLAGMGLNIQNALTGYGLGENTLSLVATGGSGSSGSGSNSNSGTNSNSGSNSNSNSNSGSNSNDVGNEKTENKWSYEYGNCEYDIEGNPGKIVNYRIGNSHYQHVMGPSGHYSHIECGGKESCITGQDFPTCTQKSCADCIYE